MDLFDALYGGIYEFLNDFFGHQFANFINGLLYSLGAFGF